MKLIVDLLNRLSAEIKRQQTLPFWSYKPHSKQLLFHASNAKCRFIFGGNRTGKSECGAVETIRRAVGLRPPSHDIPRGYSLNCWVVSLTRQVQRDVAQQKILKYLPKRWIVDIVMLSGSGDNPERGVIDFIIVKNIWGGTSKIGFRNCEQGRERFQGVGLDCIWFDEEPPEAVYDECLLRLLDRGGVHFATMTPLKGRTWVYDRIYLNRDNNPDLAVFSISWADNPYLNGDEIRQLERTLSADALDAREYGRFVDGGGLVFPEFTDDNIVEPFDAADFGGRYISIDPGFSNPTAVLWMCHDDAGRIYVVGDYEVAKQTADTHSAEIKQRTEALGWRVGDCRILIDSAANQRTSASASSTAELYRDNGINADTAVNKNIFDGIMYLKGLFCNALGERKLFVFRNCRNLIRELRGYYWGDNDRPAKSNDHTIDALRYCVMDIKKQEAMGIKPLGALGLAKRRIIRKKLARP